MRQHLLLLSWTLTSKTLSMDSEQALGGLWRFKAACNMVVFLKEIEACECDLNKDIIVVQRYFEVGR